jgi:hypothetical protein
LCITQAAKATGCSLNDVLLAVMSGAMRKYMKKNKVLT